MPVEIQVAATPVTEYDFGSADLWEVPTEVTFTIENNSATGVTIGEYILPVGFSVKLDAEPAYELGANESTEITVIAETGMAGLFTGLFEILNTSQAQLATCLFTNLVAQTQTSIVYTTRARMESAFGREAIKAWADKSGRRKIIDIQRTIDYFIFHRSRLMDSELKGGKVVVPFSTPIPEIIVGLCTKMAAFDMYSAQGVFNQDIDVRMSTVRKEYRHMMNHIRQGHMFLDTDFSPEPFSYEEDDE